MKMIEQNVNISIPLKGREPLEQSSLDLKMFVQMHQNLVVIGVLVSIRRSRCFSLKHAPVLTEICIKPPVVVNISVEPDTVTAPPSSREIVVEAMYCTFQKNTSTSVNSSRSSLDALTVPTSSSELGL